MLTDGGRNSFLGEIESEPCAAQESNNQIPQISNHIGGPSWSPSSGMEFSFSFTAQQRCGSIYFILLSNCFVDATAMFTLQSFWNPFSLSYNPPGACQPIFKVAQSLRKCVFCDKFQIKTKHRELVGVMAFLSA